MCYNNYTNKIGGNMKNKIKVDIQDKENLYNPFNKEQISEELGNYILSSSKKIPIKEKMIIMIHDYENLDEKEKEHLIDAIREYFGLMVQEKMIYSELSQMNHIILLLIGILLITLSNILTNVFPFLIPELFLIAGWVAIWETVYGILFTDNKTRVEIKRIKALTTCFIQFVDKTNN